MLHEVIIRPKTAGRRAGIAGQVDYQGITWTITKSNKVFPSDKLPPTEEMVNLVLSDTNVLRYRFDDARVHPDPEKAKAGILIDKEEQIKRCIDLWKVHIQMSIKGGHNEYCKDPLFEMEDIAASNNTAVDNLNKKIEVMNRINGMDYEALKNVIFYYAPTQAHGTRNEIYLRLIEPKYGVLVQERVDQDPKSFCAMEDFLKNYKLDELTEKRIVVNKAKQLKVILNLPNRGWTYEGIAIGITDENVITYFQQQPETYDYIKKQVDEKGKGYDDSRRITGTNEAPAIDPNVELETLRKKAIELKIQSAHVMGIPKLKEKIAEAENTYKDMAVRGVTFNSDEKWIGDVDARMRREEAEKNSGKGEATQTQITGKTMDDIARESTSHHAEEFAQK